MKKRLHDKKAGIAILISLFIISLAYVILRAAVFSNIPFADSNHGEALITAIFSALLLVFALKGKDRVFYVLSGAWIFFFVINQLYSLPNMIQTLVYCTNNGIIFGVVSAVAHICSIVSIVAIGALLVEYMSDGSICNKAFNAFCIVTVVLQAFLVVFTLSGMFISGDYEVILAVLFELSRLVMVFLFTFYAYDSAKFQLKKTNLTK